LYEEYLGPTQPLDTTNAIISYAMLLLNLYLLLRCPALVQVRTKARTKCRLT